MILIFYLTHAGGLQSVEGVDDEIELLENLLADLKAIRDAAAPKPEDLAAAPILDGWYEHIRPAPCLRGAVYGHPKLPGVARNIMTSDVAAFAPDDGWARSRSRWYRLGRRASEIGRDN